MSWLDYGGLCGSCTLGVHEYAACFCFHGQGHDVLDFVAHYVYGLVVHCIGVFSGVVSEDVPGGGTGT